MSAVRTTLLSLSFLFASNVAANAAIIGFGGLSGVANGDPFTAITESGFTVTSQSANWQANTGTSFGNPIPSIFSTDQVAATIKIVLGAGEAFTF